MGKCVGINLDVFSYVFFLSDVYEIICIVEFSKEYNYICFGMFVNFWENFVYFCFWSFYGEDFVYCDINMRVFLIVCGVFKWFDFWMFVFCVGGYGGDEILIKFMDDVYYYLCLFCVWRNSV